MGDERIASLAPRTKDAGKAAHRPAPARVSPRSRYSLA